MNLKNQIISTLLNGDFTLTESISEVAEKKIENLKEHIEELKDRQSSFESKYGYRSKAIEDQIVKLRKKIERILDSEKDNSDIKNENEYIRKNKSVSENEDIE